VNRAVPNHELPDAAIVIACGPIVDRIRDHVFPPGDVRRQSGLPFPPQAVRGR